MSVLEGLVVFEDEQHVCSGVRLWTLETRTATVLDALLRRWSGVE